ncbi:MAG: glycosyltransferase family 4 protein [Deltaproteobacteria bacterium]|nr:glycosyltransferase family 4 protein [Deltaproteobacteria bacterium]
MFTILHSESSLGWGGQENRTLHECLGLKSLGARVIVLCKPESRLKEKAQASGLEVRTHPMRSNRDLRAVRYVMGLIKSDSVDVVSTHSGDDSFICAIAGRLSKRKPVIVRTRHLALPITSKITYSVFPHAVVTVSDYVRRYLVEDKGIDGKKVVSIPTGIDLKKFSPDSQQSGLREELGAGPGTLIVGTVAILRRKKGHHVLLDAAPAILKEAPNTLFVFVGDGPQKENIEDKIKKLGIGGNVKLLGLRPDVPSILKGLDIVVLPTLQEALGTSILEASAMGKPVISTKVGGVPEVVRDNSTGILVQPEDPEGLACAVIKLLKDSELRVSMGERGRKMVEEEYSTEKMAERLYALYSRLLQKRAH